MKYEVGEYYVGIASTLKFHMLICKIYEQGDVDFWYRYEKGPQGFNNSYTANAEEMKSYKLRKYTKLERALK
jgi:hypothetical protein